MKLSLSADVIALNSDTLGNQKTVDVCTELGGYRSKLEKKAAETWITNTLEWWEYEPFRLIFPGGGYTPDFFGEIFGSERLAAIEVKGYNKNMRADRLKFRVAAEHHRWMQFCWLTWKDGDWNEEWYEPTSH